MNKEQFLNELEGVTYDMHRDTGVVPSADTLLWYRAVGLDDDYIYDLFCETWNKKNAHTIEYVDSGRLKVNNEMTPDMCRHFLVTMYTLQEWPDTGGR